MCWDENFGSVIQPVTMGINMADSGIWKVIVSHTRWISVVAGGLTPAYIKVPKRSWLGLFEMIRRDQLCSVSLQMSNYLYHVENITLHMFALSCCITWTTKINPQSKNYLYISLAFFMLNEFFIGYQRK